MSGRNESFRVYSSIILAWASAVQTSCFDLLRDCGRDGVVDGLSPRDALSNLARRDWMRLDLEDANPAAGHRLARPRGDRHRDPAQDLVRLLPRVERSPLVGADDEHGVLELLVTQEVDCVGVRVEAGLCAGYVLKRQPRELEARGSVEHSRFVSRVLGHEHEEPINAELSQRPFRQRDVAEMRRVEGAAEDRRRQRITVSSPTSTSAPGFAPTARSASFSASP
jgi:hypothetical protein